MNKLKLYTRQLFLGLFFFISFSVFQKTANANCYGSFNVYQLYPYGYGQLCYAQNVTLRAEYYDYGNYVSGEFRWYTDAFDPNPVFTDYVFSGYGSSATSDYNFYADNGTTIWVSFYDNSTGCETYRMPYSFYIATTASVSQDYAYKCRDDFAKVQLSSNQSGVTFQLYKYTEYYDPWYGWVQSYILEQSNSSGYFEIDFLNPSDAYAYYAKVYQPYGCSVPYYYQLWFDITQSSPPIISGNLNIPEGSSTILYAGGNAAGFNWYNGTSLVNQGWQFSTPSSLALGTHSYTVQGVNSTGTCSTDIATVVVSVNLPDITYAPLHTELTLASKTIDLSKPVGKIDGKAGATATGASTYTIPIYSVPGTNGVEPSISLAYNSHASNGIAGFGWNITGLSSITRSGKDVYHDGVTSPVTFSAADAFILDGKRLNPEVCIPGYWCIKYLCEDEAFGYVYATAGSANNVYYFEAYTKDGTLMEYGKTSDSRVMSDDGLNAMVWRLNRIRDVNGNYIDFVYDNSYRDSRIKTIKYTGNDAAGLSPYNSINFFYKNRIDKNKIFERGATVSTNVLLDKITVESEGTVAKSYQLTYGFDNLVSLLKEIEEIGSDGSAFNKTAFLYGSQPQAMNVVTSGNFQGEVGAGDFDGDGKSDIVATSYYYDNGIRFNSGYKIITNPSTLTTLYEKTLPAGHTVIENKKLANFLTSDYNQDGRDDILLVNTSIVTYPSGNTGRKVEKFKVAYSTNNGSTDSEFPISGSRLIHPSGNFLFPGDFDGDGNQDYITILGASTPYGGISYTGYFNGPAISQFNKQIVSFFVPGSNWVEDVANANRISVLDFNGDRKMELLITKGLTSYIMSIDYANNVYTASIIFTSSDFPSTCRLFPGDFNADGKTDMLVRYTNGVWNLLYSTGVNFISHPFSFNQSVSITGTYSDDKVVVADFNGDGISDILHGYNFFQNGTSTTSRLSFYYGRGYGSTFNYEQLVYNKVLPYVDLTIGDFNGDGRSDLLAKGFYFASPADIIQVRPSGTERLMAKVSDGFNLTTSFSYKTLTDKSSFPYIYNRTVSLDDFSNTGAINYVQLPFYVLSSTSMPNGIGGNQVTTYQYEDAMLHKRGKGFLGFKKISSFDLSSGHTNVVENAVNGLFAVMFNTRQAKYLTSNSQILSETLLTTVFDNLSSGTNKRYFQKITKTLEINHFYGTASEVTSNYDNFGNITSSVSKEGTPSGGTVSPIETTTVTSTYGSAPYLGRPENVTVTKQRIGMPSLTATTITNYTVYGRVASRVEFAGLPKAVTTSYSYNTLGNKISETVSASGMATRTTTATYDAKGRYAITTTIGAGSAVAQTETFTVDGKWGKPLTKLSSDCLSSTMEYDGFGRLKETTSATTTINTSYHWDVQGLNLYYMRTDYSGGKPDSKEWYDLLGRQTKQRIAGFNGQWKSIDVTYDFRGNISTKTTPYLSSESPTITSNYYDVHNRLISVSNSLSTVNHSYNVASGNLTTTTTDLTGQTSSKTVDPTGKVISTSDKGGNLYFSYDSRGNQVEVKHGNTIITTNVYDNYGRQTSNTDVNSGTTTYDYNAFAQLVQQTDNNGNTSTMVYDEIGRIVSRTGAEGAILYEYYKDNATGCLNNNLQKVTGFGGIVKEYTYNGLKKVQTEKTTIAGVPYITNYNYDADGNLSKINYPSGIEINKVYDNNGELISVTGGNPGAQTSLFSGVQQNGYGQYTAYTLANGKTSQITYENGMPTRYYAQGVQDLNFNFDFAKGNLLSRYDAIKNLTENFQFDGLNRLTESKVNGVVQFNINYDGNNSFSMGNIVSKSDAGNYVYKNDKIHAVAYITNPAGATAPPVSHSSSQQQITYTPFLRAASITEGVNQLNFSYAPDYDRIKTELFTNGNLSETRIYLGQYEKQIVGSLTRDIHYVEGGNGMCAIIVKENGVNNFYVTYNDYQGSLLTLTNLSGAIIAEQNFDAWGRKRNPTTWSYAAVPSNPSWLYRGYTGHEHLDQFGLINMNNRMYDPIMGRMISPDNYVSDPLGTQAYNRYSYANNNPLLYSDPDGNLPVLPIIVGAVMGAYSAGVAVNNGQLNPFKWDNPKTFSYVLGGAIVGAASGALGAAVSASTVPFANTMGIVVSSYTNSIGMAVLTGGPLTVGFGFGSYNFETGELNYLGKKGNSFLTNIGFAFGLMANVQDAFAGLKGTNVEYRAEGGDGVPHARLTGKYGIDPDTGQPYEIDVSVSHKYDAAPGGYRYDNDPLTPAPPAKNKLQDGWDYARYWLKNPGAGTHYPVDLIHPPKYSLPVKLYNVNGKALLNMTKNIKGELSLSGKSSLIYGGLSRGCHGTVAAALRRVGVFTLPINFAPIMLYAQLAIRQIGINASPFLHSIR
jgi:RHS repeat-associated protein